MAFIVPTHLNLDSIASMVSTSHCLSYPISQKPHWKRLFTICVTFVFMVLFLNLFRLGYLFSMFILPRCSDSVSSFMGPFVLSLLLLWHLLGICFSPSLCLDLRLWGFPCCFVIYIYIKTTRSSTNTTSAAILNIKYF